MGFDPANPAGTGKKAGIAQAKLERHFGADQIVPASGSPALDGDTRHAEVFERRSLVIDEYGWDRVAKELFRFETLRAVKHLPPLLTRQLLIGPHCPPARYSQKLYP
ncbi:MAG: hypothetical protein Q7V31_05320 [Parvibaculum sp.]|nr:hypothetical protein [Parvibaculum sp.]